MLRWRELAWSLTALSASSTALSAVQPGLAGIAAVIWCNVRGWPPAEQRAVISPSAIVVFVTTGLWLGGTGMIGRDTIGLFLIGLPALTLGTWAGLQLFGKLDDAKFRRVVLALLLVSGVSLLGLGR
jgi:hypothetical protein